jgi:hypothetical protein
MASQHQTSVTHLQSLCSQSQYQSRSGTPSGRTVTEMTNVTAGLLIQTLQAPFDAANITVRVRHLQPNFTHACSAKGWVGIPKYIHVKISAMCSNI